MTRSPPKQPNYDDPVEYLTQPTYLRSLTIELPFLSEFPDGTTIHAEIAPDLALVITIRLAKPHD